MALKINLLFPFLLVPKCNMNSVCRPGPSHLATLMDGFPCPINSGPLACFLYVSQIHGWLYSGTVERNYSTLLTRLFGKKKKRNQLSIQSWRGEMYLLWGGHRDSNPVPSEECSVSSFSPCTTILDHSRSYCAGLAELLFLFCFVYRQKSNFLCKHWREKK